MYLNANHWALFFVSVISREIYYIDPIGTSETELDNIANKFVELVTSKKYLKNKEFTKILVNHQKQNDSFNCGVYVCYFFELLINRNIAGFNINIDINNFRRKILETIKKNSKMTVCCVCHKANTKKKNFLTKYLSKTLIYLECKHAYHKECIENETCIACQQIEQIFSY